MYIQLTTYPKYFYLQLILRKNMDVYRNLPINMFIKAKFGNSLVVQWLELGTLTAGGRVQSLVRELRSLEAAWPKNK